MGQAVELKRRVIKGQAAGPHLLIVGGVHGDEFEPMAAVRQLIHTLDPAALRGRVTLVPCVNEAAFHRGHRTAEDGLDLARVCPGDPDGSITQRTAHALSELIRSADYFIDLHTGGTTLELLPLAGYGLHPDPAVLDVQRRMARAFNLPLIWGTTPFLNGRSLSVARDAKVPAIYTEWGGAAICRPEAIEGYVAGCLNVMRELGLLAEGEQGAESGRDASGLRYLVEDDRVESGYLQGNNPAPFAGFFEPAVKLGEVMPPGGLLGTVCDVLGERVEKVRVAAGGLVIMLRSFSQVGEGETLGAVIEMSRVREI